MHRALTDDGSRVHALAHAEADRLHHHWIGCEHLLLGLAAMEAAPVSQTMSHQGADLKSLRREISTKLSTESMQICERQGRAVTPRATVVLALAHVEAERLGARAVRSEHILLALLTEGESLAVSALLALGVNLHSLTVAVVSLLDVAADTKHRYLREREAATGQEP